MTDRLRDLADSLAAKPEPKPAKNRQSTKFDIALIEETLLQLLNASESDSVRIAAAKVLLERKGALKKDEHDAQMREAIERDAEEREAAIAEAQALLAEFAFAKSASLDQPGAVDQDRAAATADAEQQDVAVADLVDTGGAGLGQDQMRR
jgi:hypothetical protein